jgi:predicted short-subunit dehydrogenase-like oxidoreductase (DUF2520 family)
MDITVVGSGRAGTSLVRALSEAGHVVRLAHHDDLASLGASDLVVLAVPDDAIASVAAALPVRETAVVAHVAGSRGLDELAGHPRRGFFHPLAALPTPEVGAARLHGALFSVGGDPLVDQVVASLGGRAIRLSDDQRAAYHATATVAANHLVALLGHVEVLAESAGLSLADYWPLVEQAVADVAVLGVARALTGPASRNDVATIDKHLAAIPASERSTYVAMAQAAFELAEQRRAAV